MATKNQLNLQELSADQLVETLESFQRELQKMQFSHAVSTLANPNDMKTVRRNIARCMTEMRRRELAETGADGRDKLRARRARIKQEVRLTARLRRQKAIRNK
jgi:large subunit ribosomal protein L29